ncbi:Transposase DDE domain-containing protein [Streptomyces sp. TverLS-915]|nr:Transposase DDE domain-containing protein [Streptomyces sp. TverLS-915]
MCRKRRNVVERCFNRFKQWRGIATRYDEAAESCQAAVPSPPCCWGMTSESPAADADLFGVVTGQCLDSHAGEPHHWSHF